MPKGEYSRYSTEICVERHSRDGIQDKLWEYQNGNNCEAMRTRSAHSGKS